MTFTCDLCGKVEEKGPESEALAELHREFGDVDPKDCSIVCDECFEEFKQHRRRQ